MIDNTRSMAQECGEHTSFGQVRLAWGGFCIEPIFLENEGKCTILQEFQILFQSIQILGEMNLNVQLYKNPNFWEKLNRMSKCTRIPIFGRVNLHFKRNKIKCPNVQESQFLVKSIYILRGMKSNVQMYKKTNFWWSQFTF